LSTSGQKKHEKAGIEIGQALVEKLHEEAVIETGKKGQSMDKI